MDVFKNVWLRSFTGLLPEHRRLEMKIEMTKCVNVCILMINIITH